MENQMPPRSHAALLLVSALALAGCQTTTDSGDDGGDTDPPEIFGENGALYAGPGVEVSDGNGTLFLVPLAQLEPSGTGYRLALEDGGLLNLVKTQTGALTIGSLRLPDGRLVPFSNGAGVLDGEQIRFDRFAQNGSSFGFRVFSLEDGGLQSYVATGFETRPSELPASGNASWSGPFEAVGNATSQGAVVGDYAAEGTISISANFGTESVTGSIAVTETVDSDGPISKEVADRVYALSDGQLDGGQFSAGIDVAQGRGCTTGCFGTSRVDGAFYGPGASEAAGVAAIEFEQITGGTRRGIEAVGGFAATAATP